MEAWGGSVRKKRLLAFLFAAFFCFLAGCGRQDGGEESGYPIWYMNRQETKVDYKRRELQAEDTQGLVEEALKAMKEAPEDEAYKPVLPEDVRILGYELKQNQLYLDFSAEYLNMPKVYEVLCRAALVRTLCQIPKIVYVGFQVDGEPLTELDGSAVGLMNEGQFIENAGEEVNACKTAKLTLYYTNKAGDKLVAHQGRVECNSNISLEKLIVEKLIEGPSFEGAYPVIPSQTRLISVTVRDGICYVNLDEGFLATGYNVVERIPVYAIVNSLIANTDVQKVQISINGESNRIFWENINFETIFEKNEELIE